MDPRDIITKSVTKQKLNRLNELWRRFLDSHKYNIPSGALKENREQGIKAAEKYLRNIGKTAINNLEKAGRFHPAPKRKMNPHGKGFKGKSKMTREQYFKHLSEVPYSKTKD